MSAPLLNRRCSVPGCPRKHVRRGHCQTHACQVDRHGRLTPEREWLRERTKCGAIGCPRAGVVRPVLGGGFLDYCSRHAGQLYEHGRLTPESEREMGHGPTCKTVGCVGKHRAKGYCAGCYGRLGRARPA